VCSSDLAFSAVKIDGQRAYAVARAGREVILQPKDIWIEHLTLLHSPDSDHTDFEVVCGSGTYVRSMARDIAIALGTVGHCTRIIRTQVGVFTAKESILLDSLIEMPYESARALLWQLSQGLDDIPALQLTEEEARRVHSGQVLRLISRQDADRLPVLLDTKQILAMYGERIIAICEVDGVTVKPVRVINT
jgi:tRNA pseudouridine55 synthase